MPVGTPAFSSSCSFYSDGSKLAAWPTPGVTSADVEAEGGKGAEGEKVYSPLLSLVSTVSILPDGQP